MEAKQFRVCEVNRTTRFSSSFYVSEEKVLWANLIAYLAVYTLGTIIIIATYFDVNTWQTINQMNLFPFFGLLRKSVTW